jgi:RimJ/RimL family protein N-acetyltransferase
VEELYPDVIVAGNIEHAKAIAKAAGVAFNPECNVVIAREENGKLLGGVIYQGYTGASIGIHVASFDPHWLNRDMLWAIFYYPFGQLGVQKLIGQTPSDNIKSLRFSAKLGFKEEARVEGVFHNADLIITSMQREDCRWLKRGHRGK